MGKASVRYNQVLLYSMTGDTSHLTGLTTPVYLGTGSGMSVDDMLRG